jgi:hypothetical protein
MSKSKLTVDMTAFNKKIKNLKKKAKVFEVGLFEPEQARKGILLEYGDGTKQVSRPWFSNTMNPKNKDLVDLIEDSGQRYIEDDLSEDRLGKHLVSICKTGVNDPKLKPLLEYTELVKAGLLPRPDTGELRASKSGVAAEQIGIDSGDMIDSIDYKTRKR